MRALDLLFARMAGHNQGQANPIPHIRAISGSALPALVFWKSTPLPALNTLDPAHPLSTWFNAQAFSVVNTRYAIGRMRYAVLFLMRR